MTQLNDVIGESMMVLSAKRLNEFARMQREMERFFEGTLSSKTDVKSTDTHFLLSFELPGVKKEDIRIELQDGWLTISAERKQEKGSLQSFGTFEKSFTVPAGTKAEQIETEYRDGVLRVAVPKADATPAQSVKVGEGRPGFWDRLLRHKKVA